EKMSHSAECMTHSRDCVANSLERMSHSLERATDSLEWMTKSEKWASNSRELAIHSLRRLSANTGALQRGQENSSRHLKTSRNTSYAVQSRRTLLWDAASAQIELCESNGTAVLLLRASTEN